MEEAHLSRFLSEHRYGILLLINAIFINDMPQALDSASLPYAILVFGGIEPTALQNFYLKKPGVWSIYTKTL